MSEIEQQQSQPASGLVGRVKAILVSPNAEWPVIAGESESVKSVFMRYVVPLAAIGPICGFIGGQVFGINAIIVRIHPSLISGLSTAITSYVLGLVGTFLVAWVANFLADKFGGQANYDRAFRLVAYAYTAGWVAGVFQLLPSLWILVFLASLYGIYLFYLGATPMMAVPKDKAAGYTAVTIVGVIIVGLIVAAVTAPISALFAPTPTLAANTDSGNFEMNVPGAGQMKVATNGSGTQTTMDVPGAGRLQVTDDGKTQTMEIPGVGKVQVSKDGNTVNINGDNINAEVKDPDAGK